MWNESEQTKKEYDHFLLTQKLSELKAIEPNTIKEQVCRANDVRDKVYHHADPFWRGIHRSSVIEQAARATPGSRFGLVCDAGLGKTFNMRWLLDQLCAPNNRHLFSTKLPFLIRLDDSRDLDHVLRACDSPDALLDRLTGLVHLRNPGTPIERIRSGLLRKREQGHLTLLFDGLDHALTGAHFAPRFAELLSSDHWKQCPVWVSGRPYAFREGWDAVFAPKLEQWKFLRVEELKEVQIRQYVRLCVGPGDWFGAFPESSRWLLSVPRLLKLICDIIRGARNEAPGHGPDAVVAGLGLRTAADVYHTAYFRQGTFGKPDTYGLIAQGSKGALGDDGVRRFIGLRDGVALTAINFEDCVWRTGEMIGEIAFHLFDAYSDAERPEPNTSGMPISRLRGAVAARLGGRGAHGCDLFDRDLELLKHTNAHHLDFLVLAEAGERLKFENRTAQAFFTAHWVLTHSTPSDRASLLQWVTDKRGRELSGFDEFWQFAADLLPGRAPRESVASPRIDPGRWREVFQVSFAAPQTITGAQEWMQWHRRTVYYRFRVMRDWFPEVIAEWRASEAQLGPEGWQALTEFLTGPDGANFREIPAGWCQFGADPVEGRSGTPVWVEQFWLHRYPVSNAAYELFDPRHRGLRWFNGLQHPLAEIDPNGDDWCPVVNVTWYDAWCFAAWCGCELPTEERWEHAYRAGTGTRFWFDDEWGNLSNHSWFVGNSLHMTHPTGERPVTGAPHPHGLFDMAGNVDEWCASDSKRERVADQDRRVLRGGSFLDLPRYCRAAERFQLEPKAQQYHCGFRLCRD